MTNYDTILKSSVLDVYNNIVDVISNTPNGFSITRVSKGAFRDFATETSFGDLVAAVNLSNEGRDIRTIHKSKGAEFPCILICLLKEKEIDYIISPHKNVDDEERRIMYVAASRAQDRLVISLPNLSQQGEQSLQDLSIDVRRCDQCVKSSQPQKSSKMKKNKKQNNSEVR